MTSLSLISQNLYSRSPITASHQKKSTNFMGTLELEVIWSRKTVTFTKNWLKYSAIPSLRLRVKQKVHPLASLRFNQKMEIGLMSFLRRWWGHVDHFMSTSLATLVVSPGRKEAYPCRIWLSTPVVFARTCSMRTTWRYWKQIYKRLWTAWSPWYLRSKNWEIVWSTLVLISVS